MEETLCTFSDHESVFNHFGKKKSQVTMLPMASEWQMQPVCQSAFGTIIVDISKAYDFSVFWGSSSWKFLYLRHILRMNHFPFLIVK